jgi:hypothetical protein
MSRSLDVGDNEPYLVFNLFMIISKNRLLNLLTVSLSINNEF